MSEKNLTLYNFAMMHLISGPKAVEFLHRLENIGPGEQSLGIYDPATGFCLKVYTLEGAPVQWFIRGPLTETQASAALETMGVPASSHNRGTRH